MNRRILLTTFVALTASTGALAASSYAASNPDAQHGQMQQPPGDMQHRQMQMQAPRSDMQRGPQRDMGPMPRGEPQRMPRDYMPPSRPEGIQNRPSFDRDFMNHNFQANEGHRIGPYHGPEGFEYRRWRFGEMLPLIFWDEQYWLSDYWLFGLDIPPVGYEWVRYGPDAILVDVATGEIVQVVYDEFR
ncbi:MULTISPECIES: RcnB family protein [unclassified Brevundimonas]|uniref:RcnB family protein n=1 Tax=unclassified Brevundimonas TaxID=2622653 RepID=UPI003F936401